MISPGSHDPTHLQPPSHQEVLVGRRRRRLAGSIGAQTLDFANIPRISNPEERIAAFEQFKDHLVDISADPSGTDPSLYIPPEMAEVIARFEQMPDKNKWKDGDGPGVAHLVHDDITFHWFRRRPGRTPIRDAQGNPIFGRRIGYLQADQFETPVLYCSDRKLRMSIPVTGGEGRHKKLPKYAGYCRLPDLAIGMPVRSRGSNYLVMHRHNQSKSLAQELGVK